MKSTANRSSEAEQFLKLLDAEAEHLRQARMDLLGASKSVADSAEVLIESAKRLRQLAGDAEGRLAERLTDRAEELTQAARLLVEDARADWSAESTR